NLNISFSYVEGESVLMGLNKEAAMSSGSACTSATLEPSYVIAAIGASTELAHSSIRFSLHRFTTDEEVEYVGRRTVEVIGLRPRDRVVTPGQRVAEGQDRRSDGRDQEHRHRERAQAAAGQDPLLGAGGGRDQGGAVGLQGEVG